MSDVIRFVSLRKPDSSYAIPLQSVVAKTSFQINLDAIDCKSPDVREKLAQILDKFNPIAQDELFRSYSWGLAKSLSDVKLVENVLRNKSGKFDKQRTELIDTIQRVDSHKDECDLIADTWLASRLGRILKCLPSSANTITCKDMVSIMAGEDANSSNYAACLRAVRFATLFNDDSDLINYSDTVRSLLSAPITYNSITNLLHSFMCVEPEEESAQDIVSSENTRDTHKEKVKYQSDLKREYDVLVSTSRKLFNAYIKTFQDVNDAYSDEDSKIGNTDWMFRIIPRKNINNKYSRAQNISRKLKILETKWNEILSQILTDSERNILADRVGKVPATDLFDSQVVQQDIDEALNDIVQEANIDCKSFSAPPELVLPDVEYQPPWQQNITPGVRLKGVADLLLIRETHKRYEAHEIAHIENVLPKETKTRDYNRSMTTENTLEVETYEETETERDIKTSDRFELKTQSEKTISEEFSIEAGVDVTRYGSVKIEASLDSSYSRSKQESEQEATSFAKEVVDRAVDRVQKSVRELRKSRIIETIEEKNHHGIGPLDDSYSGVYKWVNKIQEVELRQYGKRLMVEFFIPEPSLYLSQTTVPHEFDPPPELNIQPSEIHPTNYMCLARKYDAVDVKPPPPVKRFVEYAWKYIHDRTKAYHIVNADAEVEKALKIPQGYIPIAASVRYSFTGSDLDLHVSVAGTTLIDGRPTAFTNTLYSFLEIQNIPTDEGSMGVTIKAHGYSLFRYSWGVTVLVTVTCNRDPDLLQKWQLETYEKLLQGHQRQLAIYEEKLSRQNLERGIYIRGRNPEENRRRERDEFKRNAIELLRTEALDLNSINSNVEPEQIMYATVNENRDISLFYERSFEWTQMVFFLYPYYWGRKEFWETRMNVSDPDPMHQNFLRAGAARVLVPVTPGFELKILNYLESALPEKEKVLWEPDLDQIDTDPSSLVPFSATEPELWMEMLIQKKRDLAYGTGSLTVKKGSNIVDINADSNWNVGAIDENREIYIKGVQYLINIIMSDKQFRLDRDYLGDDDTGAKYLVGSVRIGSPWEVVVPTNLVILAEENDKLNL